MNPLYCQLYDRYEELSKTEESLERLTTEDIPDEMLETLGIDLYPMDIETGATSPSATSYFLPRHDFPSCRVMKGDLEVCTLEMGNFFDDKDYKLWPLNERLFGTALEHMLSVYTFQLSRNFSSRFLRLE